jgi:hypothetical protein
MRSLFKNQGESLLLNRFMIAATMAPFLAFGMPSGAYACPEHSGEHHEISAEDKAADDSRCNGPSISKASYLAP